MRVAIDYTSALTQRAGVGRYTRSLVDAFSAQAFGSAELLLWLAADSPDPCLSSPQLCERRDVLLRRLPLTERWLTLAWQRLRAPASIERFIGHVDVVHAPDFVGPPARAPLVATIHDLSYLITPELAFPKLRRYLTAAVPRTLARAARVVAVSQATADDLAERYGLPSNRIVVIPHGVDPSFRHPNPESRAALLERYGIQPPYFIMVGTIEPRKNHATVLAAFAQVREVRPDVSLVIVGRAGWLAEPILTKIREAERAGGVYFLAAISDGELPALYAGSIALVYPSWYEGYGLPVVEAMAAGTAVITSERGALGEVAGDAALGVPPESDEAIAAAMLRVYDDSSLRTELVRRGEERVAGLTWETSAQAHLRVYREVSDRG